MRAMAYMKAPDLLCSYDAMPLKQCRSFSSPHQPQLRNGNLAQLCIHKARVTIGWADRHIRHSEA